MNRETSRHSRLRPGCSGDLVRTGDDWLRGLLGTLMAGPDWASGRLMVVIAWDEGSSTDNHIPGLVLSPTTSHVNLTRRLTNCAILRLMSGLTGLAEVTSAISQINFEPGISCALTCVTATPWKSAKIRYNLPVLPTPVRSIAEQIQLVGEIR